MKIKLNTQDLDRITEVLEDLMPDHDHRSNYYYFDELKNLFWAEFGAVLCLRDYRGTYSSVWIEFERETDATYFKLKWS